MDNIGGKMAVSMKAITNLIRSMALESMNGQMGVNTRETGIMESSMVKVNMYCQMAKSE